MSDQRELIGRLQDQIISANTNSIKASIEVRRLRETLHHVKLHAHMAPETERIVDAALAEGGKG